MEYGKNASECVTNESKTHTETSHILRDTQPNTDKIKTGQINKIV